VKRTKNFIWVLWIGIRFCFLQFLLFAIIMVLVSCLSIGSNVIKKYMFNELLENITDGQISQYLILLIIMFVSILFLRNSSGFLQSFVYNITYLKINCIYRKLFMYRTVKLPQEKFLNNESIKKYSFVSKNLDKVGSFIMTLFGALFSTLSEIGGTLIVFAIYMPELIVYAIAVGVIYGLVSMTVAKVQYKMSKEQIDFQRKDDYYSSLLMDKNNAKEIRINKSQQYLLSLWTNIDKKLMTERINLANKNNNIKQIADIISYLSEILVVFLLIYRVYTGDIDIGIFIMLFSLISACNVSIKYFVQNLIAGTYFNLLYIDEYADFIKPVKKDEWHYIKELDVDDGNLVYGSFQELEVDHVYFKYPESAKECIIDVNLKVKKGEIISILGYNGSGKTTLTKLMAGILTPCKGSVKLNEHTIDSTNQKEILRYFGIAFQDFPRFAIPLDKNVAVGRIENMVNSAVVEKAYRKGGLKSIIQRLPKGDKTVLGKVYDSEGVDLSGGEWQRVIISNSYMGDPEIIIFDEPTANIDPIEEVHLIENLRENLAGKTAILISHRIGFARLADRIVMMKEGEINEVGTHEELIKKQGYYFELFQTLKKLYDQTGSDKE
jgi:ABC-type multidrug transport system fused ATPase/permease subunit